MSEFNNIEIDQVIPELHYWDNGKPVDVLRWINAIGNFTHAIAYGAMFWPDFFKYDGCVFRGKVDTESYFQILKKNNNNKEFTESFLNHIHICDLFYSYQNPPSALQLIYLGRLLRDMWRAKLQCEFPFSNFVVHLDETIEDSDYDIELTFYQTDHKYAGSVGAEEGSGADNSP